MLGERLSETGYFDAGTLRELVDTHQSGASDHSAPLWTLLMFEAFLRNVVDGADEEARGESSASGTVVA